MQLIHNLWYCPDDWLVPVSVGIILIMAIFGNGFIMVNGLLNTL
jgi:hypothetical protein